MRLVCVKTKVRGKKYAEVKRIPIEEAEVLVSNGSHTYAAKKEWRKHRNALLS